jgi:imidazolonepropionase-like amidohydrolase
MKKSIFLIFTFFAWLPLAAQRASQPAESELLIRNATILTITQGTIPDGAVLIRGSRIAAVGPENTIRAGAAAQVIDAGGGYVMPGIIDAHSHTAIEGGVNEGTLVNTAMVRIDDVLTNQDINSYRQLAGGTTTALVLHGSANAIGGQSAVVKWKWGRPLDEWIIRDAPRGIKFALGENPKRSNFVIPGVEQRYPNTRMGVEDVIRDSFERARAYTAEWDEYNARRRRGETLIPPRRDLQLETVAGILRGEVLVHSHCYRADEIVMLLDLAEQQGFRVQTLQHVLEGYKVAPEIARHGAAASTFIDWWGFKAEAYDGIAYNPALMNRSGVNVSLNSDPSELARRLNLEAAKAMKYGGVSEDDALRMITINPANQLGVGRRIGSIEPGKDADLVIWSGHPLSTYSRVETTLIEGVVYFDRNSDLRQRGELRAEKERLLRQEREAEERERRLRPDTPASDRRETPEALPPPVSFEEVHE